MDLIYKNKYLKYKSKYLKIKKMIDLAKIQLVQHAGTAREASRDVALRRGQNRQTDDTLKKEKYAAIKETRIKADNADDAITKVTWSMLTIGSLVTNIEKLMPMPKPLKDFGDVKSILGKMREKLSKVDKNLQSIIKTNEKSTRAEVLFAEAKKTKAGLEDIFVEYNKAVEKYFIQKKALATAKEEIKKIESTYMDLSAIYTEIEPKIVSIKEKIEKVESRGDIYIFSVKDDDDIIAMAEVKEKLKLTYADYTKANVELENKITLEAAALAEKNKLKQQFYQTREAYEKKQVDVDKLKTSDVWRDAIVVDLKIKTDVDDVVLVAEEIVKEINTTVAQKIGEIVEIAKVLKAPKTEAKTEADAWDKKEIIKLIAILLKNGELIEEHLKVAKKIVIEFDTAAKKAKAIVDAEKKAYLSWIATCAEKQLKNVTIHGPVSYYYFELTNGKKILLLGDIHTNYNMTKVHPDHLSILEFLEILIAKNINIESCFDFFLEDAYSVAMQTQYQKGGYIQPLWYKTMVLLRVYFELGDGERCIQQNIEIDTKSEDELIQLTKKEFLDKEYLCPSGFRYHVWDLAQHRFSDDLHPSWFNTLTFSMTEAEMHKLYMYFIGVNNSSKYQDGQTLYREKYKKIYSDYLQQTKPKSQLFSIQQIELTGEKINKQLNNLDTTYCTKNNIIKYFLRIITQKSSKPYTLRTIFTDTYTIARMFRKFKKNKDRIPRCTDDNSLKNILYFGGDTHVRNIVDFLETLGWKPTDSEDAKDDSFEGMYDGHYITLKQDNYLF